MTNQPNNYLLIADQYKVVRTLSGGMGHIFLCVDINNKDFPVALKTFKQQYLSDRDIRDYFLREATIWVNLGFHPNIVQAYKVLHIAEDQSVYIIMQLVPAPTGFSNPSLRAHLENRGPFTDKDSLLVTLDVVRGMKYADSIIPNIVHRDLKPENILLETNNNALITDFGLAGIPFPNTQNETSKFNPLVRTITKTGGIGTPLYMSPEQWLGSHVDQRTDIYALGCILFEMLTKRFVVMANDISGLNHEHSSGGAIKNLQKSAVHPEIKTFLEKCLHPDYQKRFNNWNEVENELEILIERISGKKISFLEVLTDVSRLHEYQIAESMLAIGSAYVNISDYTTSVGYFERAQDIAENQQFQDILALALANQGVVCSSQGLFVDAINYFQRAIQLFQDLGDPWQICYHTGNIGNAYFGLYDLINAQKYLQSAYEMAIFLNDHLSQARWIGNLGNIYSARGDFESALNAFKTALEISHQTTDRGSICKHLGSIGIAYEGLGKFNKAEEYYQLGIKEAKEIGDRQSEGILLLSIGNLYSRQKKIKVGILYIKSALLIGKEINDRLLVAKALGNLGNAYMSINDFDTGMTQVIESIQIAKQIDAKDVIARGNWALGLAFLMKERFNDAIEHLRAAVIEFKSLNMSEYENASEFLKKIRQSLGLM